VIKREAITEAVRVLHTINANEFHGHPPGTIMLDRFEGRGDVSELTLILRSVPAGFGDIVYAGTDGQLRVAQSYNRVEYRDIPGVVWVDPPKENA
jgi:hypothetical protein